MIIMKYRFLRFPEFKTKALTFSYDDGTATDKNVLQILNSYSMKGTFNIDGACIHGQGRGLTKEELKTIYKGHEIAVHGYEHKALINSSLIDGIKEVLMGREEVENFYGKIIRGFAYPDRCATTPEIMNYLKELDIAYARTAGGETGSFKLPENWLCWMPTAKHTDSKLMEYAEKFVSENPRKKYYASADPMLFYVWGHSSELDGKWDILENFCKLISTDDDIWYATNMEIYEYVKAYNSLIFNVSNTLVTNPTLHTVYFETEKNAYKVNPGETITVE